MRERLVTLGLALGALALFVAMFLHGDADVAGVRDVPRPTTTEHRGNGYFAAATWLAAERVRVLTLREHFGELAERTDMLPRGNLLIVTLPAVTGFKTEEFLPLDRWVRAGNTLFVLAALADHPDWALGRAGLVPGELNLLTGLEFESVRSRENRAHPQQGRSAARGAALSEDFKAFVEPQRSALAANRAHAYFLDVREAIALSDYAHQPWALRVPYEGFALELGHVRDDGSGALWTRALGAGRIIVSGFGTLFTNRALPLGDNARLLANIIAADVAPGGAVIFDDAHQGIRAAYDPAKFYRDRRLHATLAIALGLWLAWVLGSTRLRLPVQRIAAPREADLVRATGGFLARVLPNPVAAHRMIDNLLVRLAPRGGWDYLRRQPRLDADDLEQLQRWYAAAQAKRRVPLKPLHDLIVRIDRHTS